ncbi:MAG: hypothetical protein VKP70_04155 [Cyanobacteriota bacterium]|nr:hypothetical protein [Cyanobacteriota bacterium]
MAAILPGVGSEFPGVLPPILLSSSPRAFRSRRHARQGVGGSVTPAAREGAPSAVPLFLAAVLVSAALLLAPEQPRDQEAICQRHSGEVACRVW